MKKMITISLFSFLFFVGCGDDIFIQNINSKSITKSDSTTVKLKRGESITINGELNINFDSVPTDSRCPIDAMCVWAGDGEIKLNLKLEKTVTPVSLHTTLTPKTILWDNYEIQLINLFPTRRAAETITQDQYSIELKIKHLNSAGIKNVYFIDSNSEGLIRKDALVVNSAVIQADLLTASVSYSGGCTQHSVNLYAYSGILKSNPPQLSLVLSHNGNGDLCEAYITGQIKFDLKNLKEYLGGMRVYDKIILNIANPDGTLIKQSPLVYNLR